MRIDEIGIVGDAELAQAGDALAGKGFVELDQVEIADLQPDREAGDPQIGQNVLHVPAPDASGRQSPEVIEGADYVEPADLVVQALGFEPEDLPLLWGVPELKVTRWGTIKADFRSHATSLPGVYAVGDIVRGASLVVWAIRDGREAADAILAYLAQGAQVAAE